MEVLKFLPKSIGMIQEAINNQPYFFTINHITREGDDRHIYGIRLNYTNYFLSKTIGVPDAEQLDINEPLPQSVLLEINAVLTTMEHKYHSRQPLEILNREVFSTLVRMHAAA